MMKLAKTFAAAGLAGALAAPAPAQYYPVPTYPPSTYPYPGQTYPYPGQTYGPGTVIGQVIDNLLGNRYSVNDRGAVSRCADAAVNEAVRLYRPYLRQGYESYGPWGYNNIRVTAVTDVERRSNGGLRVRGLLDSGLRYGMYNPGVIDPRYAGQGDLTFRCNMDFRGYVTDVRIRRRD